MHLHIAERIQAHPELNAAVRAQVVAAWPSFYLGSVAPDFQDITDIPREATHFYSLPPDINSQAQAVMLAQYPELAQASRLPLPQAVFVAAYMAHLMLDVRWFREVLAPFFVFNTAWDGVGRFERFTAHNTLLTYLDRLALTALPDSAESTLAAAPTAAMAAFIPADDLRRWQQYIVEQLAPARRCGPSKSTPVACTCRRPTSAAIWMTLPGWKSNSSGASRWRRYRPF